MLERLKNLVEKDTDLPKRAWRMQWLDEFRLSTIYDRLPHDFCDETERGAGKKYIPLRDRKPSVRYGLPMVIVNDSTALLFSEGHFPPIQCTIGRNKTKRDDSDEKLDRMFQALVRETDLRAVMLDGAQRGSIGSACFWLRIIEGRVFFEALSTTYLTPKWKKNNPRVLEQIEEKYKTTGRELREEGYTHILDKDLDRKFWFCRQWTELAEVWYEPWPVRKADNDPPKHYPAAMTVDVARTVKHSLGFVPMVWAKNLPGGDKIDGRETFLEPVLHNSVEIDYLLSQTGRGLKYNSDPTLVLKEAGVNIDGDGEPLIRGGDKALRLGPQDEAYMLELSGTASAAVEAHVRFLRELSLELCGGNRTSPEKLSGAQSGRAMELMNQGLIWLADKLRISYGEGALVSLLKMVLKANETIDLVIEEETYPAGSIGKATEIQVSLKWPRWYPPTDADHANRAGAIKTYREAGAMSQETAVTSVASDFNVDNVPGEIEKIKAEQDEKNAQEMALATAAPPKPAIAKDAA